jgi:hypothetical protein
MSADLSLQLGHDLRLAPERELGFEPFFLRGEPKFLQALDLRLCEGFVGNVRQRAPAPQGQSVAYAFFGCLWIAVGESAAGSLERRIEDLCVELAGADTEEISVAARLEPAVRQCLSQS